MCPAGTASKGSMTATVDGAPWSAVCVPYAILNPAAGSLYVTALDQPLESGRALAITFSVAAAQQPGTPTRPLSTGTYQIGGSASSDNAGLLNFFCTPGQTSITASSCSLWQTGPGLGTGTVTVASLTAASASGTFSFSVVGTLGTTGTRTITSGAFSVTF
jgi:hypothetical protein